MERIVVGIDGSPESTRALTWAAVEAAAHDADLHVVYAYGAPEEYNPYTYATSAHGPVTTMLAERVQQDRLHTRLAAQEHAEETIKRIIRVVLGDDHGVRLEVHVVPDDRPARALIDASRRADLLVVGSRGRGGVAGLLLGSVSQACIQQARCPVTVIPASTKPEPAEADVV